MTARVAAAAGALALLATLAYLLGRSLAPAAPPSNPIANTDGILVGIEHSPAGALAAADNFIALGYGTVERNPARDALLIDTDYAPAIRASAISAAAAVRAQNAASMRLWARGGHNLSVVGARRLDAYTGDTADLTTWNLDVFWGPDRPPKQAWVLTKTTLRWTGSRWLITATVTSPMPGPVPANTPQATASNDSADAFSADLAGFTAPTYGAAG